MITMLLVLLLAALLSIGDVCPANIVMMTLGGTKSHKIPFLALGQGLVSVGHRVTLVSGFSSSYPTQVEEVTPKNVEEMIKSFSNIDLLGPTLRGQRPISIADILSYVYKVCDAFYSAPETRLLMSRKVDLLVLDGAFPECLLGLVHHFNAPFIYINTVAFYSVQLSLAGNPTMYSVTPFFDSLYSDRMTFFQRTVNGVLHTCAHGVVMVINKFFMEPLIQRHIGSDAPPNDAIGRNVSLILQNGHHSVTYPRPYLPGVIEIACIQCKEPHILPKDLEDFISRGKEKGFIYVSFGTSVQSSHIPEDLRLLMVNVFRQLPYKVLWKYEQEGHMMIDLPDNVLLSGWLPQQDVLGHENILAFVTHGGLQSIVEAVYHAVPIVTLPVFCDHSANSRKAEDDGYAVLLDLHTMTSESLLAAIQTVIDDRRFKENVIHRSELLRDQPEPPLDRALYWVQYVLRHRGAPHLQNPAKDLTLIQYFMLDTLVALMLAIYIIIQTIKFMWHLSFRRSKTCKLKTK